jgi:toxin YhaV
MSLPTSQPLVINGWSIFAHPLFLNQFEELLTLVESLRQKYPEDYQRKNATKRLAAIAKLAFDIIPQDPTRSEYRQGTTLGSAVSAVLSIPFVKQNYCFGLG